MPPRAASSPLQMSLALPDPRLSRVLARIEDARDIVLGMLDGTRPTLELVRDHVAPPAPPLLPLSALPEYEPPEDHRLVLRRGRKRRDGTRSGTRIRRKMTVYIDPDVARELELYAAAEDLEYSEVVELALEQLLERR